MQKLSGNNCKLFIMDTLTGQYYILDGVTEIEIEDLEVSEQKVMDEETMAKIFCEMLDMVINGFPDDEDFEKLMETIKNSHLNK